MTVTKANVRLEGNINQDWELFYSDGSSEKFYAYEESPRFSENDQKVHSTNEQLSTYLSKIAFLPLPISVGELDAIDFTIDFAAQTIVVTNIQRADNDYQDEAVHIVGALPKF